MSVAEASLDGGKGERAFLPPAFELVPRLLLLLDDPEADSESLAKLIKVDPGLTADVLKTANSAFYAGAYRAETLEQAIMRLGLRQIYKITMEAVALPVLTNSDDPMLAGLNQWRHSLAVAVPSQVIAQRADQDIEVAFTAGLLHDIGKIVLGQANGAEYLALVRKCRGDCRPLWKMEPTVFNTDHAKAGADLLAQWNFPEKIVAALRWHHEPVRCHPLDRALTATINLANTLAYRLGHSYGCPPETAAPEVFSTQTLGLRQRDLAGLENEIACALERERESFR